MTSITAITAPPDQNSPHTTIPTSTLPDWRKSNRIAEMTNDVNTIPSSSVTPSDPMSLYRDTRPGLRHPSKIAIAAVSAVAAVINPDHKLVIDCFNHTCTCCAKQSNAAGVDVTQASC